jgi:carbon-monoxide dehydrogenase medium subunit
VVGSVGVVPTQSQQANALLTGARSQVESQLTSAAQALAEAVNPVDDAEGSAEYKRHLISVYLRRAFIKALS